MAALGPQDFELSVCRPVVAMPLPYALTQAPTIPIGGDPKQDQEKCQPAR
jgi:hypothetical protein